MFERALQLNASNSTLPFKPVLDNIKDCSVFLFLKITFLVQSTNVSYLTELPVIWKITSFIKNVYQDKIWKDRLVIYERDIMT